MPGVQVNAFPEGESNASKRQSKKCAGSNIVDDHSAGKRYNTRPGWKLFLWNPQTKEFLGRNAASWAKIIFFYVVFYLFLAGFFACMMIIFYNTLSYERPKYTAKGGQSILSSPGLTMRPSSHYSINIIIYSQSYFPYWLLSSIDMLIERYEDTREQNKDRYQQCNGTHVRGKVCDFDVSQLTKENTTNWGYESTSPTVILKLNKVFDWEPEVLDKNSDKLPEDLREYIRNSTVNMVWLWCTCSDKAVTFRYSPQPGFPVFYYPFYNQQGYLPPLVAVTANSLPVGQYVAVTCTAYAENIKNPSLQFYIQVQE